MTIFKRKSTMKNILFYLVMPLTLITISACGGGGGSTSPQPTAKTTATLTINLTGTLPAGTSLSGTDFTVTLPGNVTPVMANGAVAAGVVSSAGVFTGSTLSPQVVYTAATAGVPGSLMVILPNSIPAGVTQIGDVATIILQLANGAVPTAADFPLSAVSVIDAAQYAAISGMGVSIASVMLQ